MTGSLRVFLVALFLLLGGKEILKAQRPSANTSSTSEGGSIVGKVKDRNENVPMQYTNVVLYRLPDSTMVNGTITNHEGVFKFTGLKNGRYYLKIHFIGFQVKTIGNIVISPQKREVKLPAIYLDPVASTLRDVEVKASRSRITYQVDKKVVNVTKDLMASAGSAIDVLENVPSIDVDLEGNVSLRGSSNFTVLINGRPSVLEGNDALQQIPASSIQRIEIITNPSAKYDPEGVGGILNIILKKGKNLGINGLINGSVGSNNKYRGNALVGYRTKKLNAFITAEGSYRDMNMYVITDDETYLPDTINYRHSLIDLVRNRNGYGVGGGLDYYLSKKATLTFSGKYGGRGFGMDNTSRRNIYTVPAYEDIYSKSFSHSSSWGNYYSLQSDYLQKFNDHGHQLEFFVYFSGKNDDETEVQSDYFTDPQWNDIGDLSSGIRTRTIDSSNDIRVKVDYSLPVGKKGKLEAGYQSRFYNENGEYAYEVFDTATGQWYSNENYQSLVDFKRNIHSAYISFKNVRNSFGYELGFRTEYTDRSVDNHDDKPAFVIQQFDFFPTVHLSYQLPDNYQVYTSYSRRINRPDQWSLNPFPMIIDPYNIRVGNPKLEPEKIDSYEFGAQKIFAKSFISFESYYRVTSNRITRVRLLDTAGIIIHTRENVDKDYSLGAELMANLRLVSWFSMNASFNIYHYKLEGSIEGEDVASNSTNWSGRMTASFSIKKSLRIQWMGIYRSKTVTLQGTRKGMFYTNLAVRKDFLKHKLNLTLSARDILGTAQYESTATGEGFHSHSIFRRESPIVLLNIAYVINNYKQKQRRNAGSQQSAPTDLGF